MSRSISRRVLLFSRGFCRFPAVSAMEGANLMTDLSEKSDSNMEFKGKSPINNLVSVACKASREPGEPRSADKAAKCKAKHNGSMAAAYNKKQEREEEVLFVPLLRKEEVAMVEKDLGYQFKDLTLLGKALTHESYYYPLKPGPSYHYDELWLIGDAVLDVLVAHMVYNYPLNCFLDARRHRAKIVCTRNLASVAVQHNLHCYLRHNSPLLEQQIQHFTEFMHEFLIDSSGFIEPPEVLPHIVRSLLGAIFVDSDHSFEYADKVFRKLLIIPENMYHLGSEKLQKLRARRMKEFV